MKRVYLTDKFIYVQSKRNHIGICREFFRYLKGGFMTEYYIEGIGDSIQVIKGDINFKFK